MKKAILGFLLGAGLALGGYIYFDAVLTPDATVIEEVKGTTLYTGTFSDADPAHKAGASFEIVADGMGGRTIVLSDDFFVANAPDPHVKINGVLIAKNMFKGGQSFYIPNLIEEDITDVKIWCKIANIPLGLGTIN